MNKISRICSVIVLSLFAVCAMAANQSPVERLSHLLKSFSTYSANFSQVTLSEQGKALQTSQGKMLIKRPGMFRWESSKPTQQILITNGKTLWVYDVDLQQATKQQLASRTTVDPAMLLSGSIKNLNENFTVTQTKSNGTSVFILKHKKQDMGFSKVTLTFQNQRLVSMLVVNNLSQTTVFKFSNIKLDALLPGALFNFKPPKGVDIISQ